MALSVGSSSESIRVPKFVLLIKIPGEMLHTSYFLNTLTYLLDAQNI